MSNLKATYIQKGLESKKDIEANWGMILKTGKLISVPKLKTPFKHTWSDEQGDDEYLPGKPCYEAQTISLEFAYIGSRDSFNSKLRQFWNYIQGGEFCLFDVFYKEGIRCRYDSYDETYKWRRDSDIFTFTMKFKVNNPLCVGYHIPNTSFSGRANVSGIAYFSDGTTRTFSAGDNISKTLSGSDNFVVIVPNEAGNIFG